MIQRNQLGSRDQYLTWIYLIMGSPTQWTWPDTSKKPNPTNILTSLDRNFRPTRNNMLDRARLFLPKIPKKTAEPENCTWRIGFNPTWPHIGPGLDKRIRPGGRVGSSSRWREYRAFLWLSPRSGMYSKSRTIWEASSFID